MCRFCKHSPNLPFKRTSPVSHNMEKCSNAFRCNIYNSAQLPWDNKICLICFKLTMQDFINCWNIDNIVSVLIWSGSQILTYSSNKKQLIVCNNRSNALIPILHPHAAEAYAQRRLQHNRRVLMAIDPTGHSTPGSMTMSPAEIVAGWGLLRMKMRMKISNDPSKHQTRYCTFVNRVLPYVHRCFLTKLS